MRIRISGPSIVLGLALGCAACGSSGSTAGGSAQGSAPPAASASGTVLHGRLVGRLRLDGLAAPLLVTREAHVRGGYQMHAYVGGGSGRPSTELLDASGNPVVPFVEGDTRPEAYASVACVARGLQVDVATPTRPSGVLRAWDVVRTTYRVDRSGAHAAGERRVATSVPDRSMHRDWADLVRDRMFVGCGNYSAPVTR